MYKRLFRGLPVIEGAAFFGAVYAAVIIRLGRDWERIAEDVGPVWPEALMFSGVLLVSMTAMGLYNQRLRDGIEGILARVVLAFGGGTLFIALAYYAFSGLFLGRGILLLSMLMSFLAVAIIRAQLVRIGRLERSKRRVLVLGGGRRAAVLTMLRRSTDLIGIRIVGYVAHPDDEDAVPADKRVELDRPLSEWAAEHGVDEIVVAPDERRRNLDMHELLSCRAHGVLVTDLTAFYERETGRINLDMMLPGWLVFSTGFSPNLVRDRVKRLLDIVVGVLLLVAASPLMLGAALAIWIESGFRGPIFYRQVRVGANGREFEVVKFRSMQIDAERDGRARWATTADPRVTRAGSVLRRSRIDELPQILNVLRGEMSFVGPRPERPEFVRELERAQPRYADRHHVKPGLTGWAQISYPYGGSEHDALQKLQFDLYYVKNRSIYLDLTILLQTAEVVLWGKGAR
mgnify:CR=1 FL=1